ncbi:25258_t:CDS:2, partial [Gigaspora rosea]
QDNTAQTNYYNFPLCLFVLIDNHNKTRIAAQALMPNKTIESFRWVMGQLKKATGILPRILMTDEDLSIKYVVAHNLPNTKYLFCLYHLSQNLLKNLRSKLGEQYADFINDFYSTRNSLSESVFETRFTNLLNKYPAASSYLRKLFLSKKSWACAYTFKIFTGGMQSTQRVEGLNNHIKTAINSSSTLLQDRINYNDHLILQTVFPQVIQQINKYLTPNLATEQQKQISWNSDSLNLQEVTYDNNFIEDIYNVSQSYLLALIKENEYSSVKEDDITKFERAQEPFLTSNRNTELAPITHQLSNATNVKLHRIDDVQENSFQKSVDKKLQFNKSMSLAKKAITLQNSENDNELDTLLKDYIEKKTLQHEKETKERELRTLRENHSSGNVLAIETDDNQLISIDDIANPLNHIGKGSPKKNRIKGAQKDYRPKKKPNQVQAQDYVDFVINQITIRAHVHKKI